MPRYLHNCPDCTPLGEYENFDLYYHTSKDPVKIIIRGSDDPKDYGAYVDTPDGRFAPHPTSVHFLPFVEAQERRFSYLEEEENLTHRSDEFGDFYPGY
tara:strand:+ start:2809 stop:3105 length:297 start_codon:yes stop_codon:yes gene_type:complete